MQASISEKGQYFAQVSHQLYLLASTRSTDEFLVYNLKSHSFDAPVSYAGYSWSSDGSGGGCLAWSESQNVLFLLGGT